MEPYTKRPYLVIALIELALIVFIAGGSAYASITEATHPAAPFIGFIPIALFLAWYFSFKKRGKQFFFAEGPKLSPRQWLDFAPLLLILMLLLIANRGFEAHPFSYFAYMLLSQLLLVGFVEESLFRGIMLRVLLHKGTGSAVFVSSFFFGVTHALQALGGQSLEDTILQIVYAFLLGLLLSLLVVKHRTIVPGILFHGFHNFLNFTGNAPSTHLYDYAVLLIMAVHILLLYRSVIKPAMISPSIAG
ncbi:CPBP family intramembrane metalloprotease [Cohnella sp. CFH 77786]|uniref:CPBP family intramembrane glutamic endopeptidase n=1 Tax=Cohnella sp. CFH 77786 TaxID=2662265 RepID=UPI001C60D352|nr:CPBP family intramembrane glutamic endopeptidase [Cohnella sp. CFH 77786]MBW5445792.1 CPBP family intramembrane metalloprotease [Cohnella sp. CFH 77786]